jgi:hypothetical protein
MFRIVIVYYVVCCVGAAAFGGIAFYLYRREESSYLSIIGDQVGKPSIPRKGARLKPSIFKMPESPIHK